MLTEVLITRRLKECTQTDEIRSVGLETYQIGRQSKETTETSHLTQLPHLRLNLSASAVHVLQLTVGQLHNSKHHTRLYTSPLLQLLHISMGNGNRISYGNLNKAMATD